MSRLIGLLLVIGLTIGASLSQRARDAVWAGYQQFRSPVGGSLPPAAVPPALTPRAVLVVVRGLREDLSLSLTSVNRLRDRGADFTLELDTPLYGEPQYMTLLSGATAEFHGFTTPEVTGKQFPDTLIAQLQARRSPAYVVGSAWWDARFGRLIVFDSTDFHDLTSRDAEALRSARDILTEPGNRAPLVIIELRLIEEVLAADPAGLDAALATTDARLSEFLASLDLNRATVIVTADRGLPAFGSEMAERQASRVPWVMAGVGVRSGTRGVTRAIHAAPTLAALIGLPSPLQAQGTPLFGALAIATTQVAPQAVASADRLAALYERWSETTGRPRFASELLQSLGDVNAADPGLWLRGYERALDARYSAERDALIAARLRFAAPIALGALLCLLAILGACLTRFLQPVIAGVLVYWAVWLGAYFGWHAQRFTLGAFPDGALGPFASLVLADSALAIAVASLAALALAQREDDALRAISATLVSQLAITITIVLRGLSLAWPWGLRFVDFLPDGAALTETLAAFTQIAAFNAPLAFLAQPVPLPAAAALVAGALHLLLHRRRRSP